MMLEIVKMRRMKLNLKAVRRATKKNQINIRDII